MPKVPRGISTCYVMKIKSKASLRRNRVEVQYRKAQARMLTMPRHPGVIPLHEVLEDDMFYYVVMEKASGGTLLRSLLSDFPDGHLPMDTIKHVIRDVLAAVAHLHENNVLHRDIKPDNLVMGQAQQADQSATCSKNVMLIDFDHAYIEQKPFGNESTGSIFGTLRFNAPETFCGRFSQQSDLYSVGTILHLLVTGKFPFDDHAFERCEGVRWRHIIAERMEAAPVDFECEPWASQPLCKDLCQRLLAIKPEDRLLTAELAQEHEWFRGEQVF